ncbi:MAG: DUF3108 domain-containing protein, partial [Longimicrobiales bacterium]
TLCVTTLVLLSALPTGARLHAQSAPDRALAPVPFGLGERMSYKVTLGVAGEVGNGVIEVLKLDTVHGFPTYQLRMHVKGGITFLKVEDEYHSWLDVQSLISRRFNQDVDEVSYESKRRYEFFPGERSWRRVDKEESGTMPTDEPLDDLSFLFYVRTLPLQIGETYTLNRYFKEQGNPVTVKVLRRDTVTVPAGTFSTIVVQPIIRTKGLFSEGGQAEVHFTDDERRIPVQITTRLNVPLLKSLNMYLKQYSPGKRLAPLL